MPSVKPSCPVCAGTGQVYPEDYDMILGKPITRHEPCGACKGPGRGKPEYGQPETTAGLQPAGQAALEMES